MKIKTNRLILCPLGTEYLETTHVYASDIENTKYMVHMPKETLDETREFLIACEKEWQQPEPLFYEFAILMNEIHIGAVSIYLNEKRDTAELGWILNPTYHNCGYASEAVAAVMNFAKERLNICHFVAYCDTENAASRKVMKKLGLLQTSCSGGRQNRGSSEERQEYMYEMYAESIGE